MKITISKFHENKIFKLLYLPIIGLIILLMYVLLNPVKRLPDAHNRKNKIVLYTKSLCSYCIKAKEFFNKNNIIYTNIDISNNAELHKELEQKTKQSTVPYIFIGDEFIGGYSNLMQLNKDLKLSDKIYN